MRKLPVLLTLAVLTSGLGLQAAASAQDTSGYATCLTRTGFLRFASTGECRRSETAFDLGTAGNTSGLWDALSQKADQVSLDDLVAYVDERDSQLQGGIDDLNRRVDYLNDVTDDLWSRADEFSGIADDLYARTDDMAAHAYELYGITYSLSDRIDELAAKFDEVGICVVGAGGPCNGGDWQALTDALSAETSDRVANDDAINARIDDEAATRADADAELWVAIGEIRDGTPIPGDPCAANPAFCDGV